MTSSEISFASAGAKSPAARLLAERLERGVCVLGRLWFDGPEALLRRETDRMGLLSQPGSMSSRGTRAGR